MALSAYQQVFRGVKLLLAADRVGGVYFTEAASEAMTSVRVPRKRRRVE